MLLRLFATANVLRDRALLDLLRDDLAARFPANFVPRLLLEPEEDFFAAVFRDDFAALRALFLAPDFFDCDLPASLAEGTHYASDYRTYGTGHAAHDCSNPPAPAASLRIGGS